MSARADTNTRPEITARRDLLMSDLEDLWDKLDALLDRLTEKDWGRRHRGHWTFADLPFHLAYFDRDIVIQSLLYGPDVPASEQTKLSGNAATAAWNYARSAKRPATQTVEDSLTQMHAGRELIRRLVAGRDDEDMERTVWLPLLGWATAYDAIETCLGHTWRHFLELRIRMNRDTPTPTSRQTHRALGNLMATLPSRMERAQAARLRRPFTVVLAFTGPGGGSWTMRVQNRGATVTEGSTARANLTITQTPEAYAEPLDGIGRLWIAVLRGKKKVKGLGAMVTFARLFS
jgi:hypothetical protein